MIKNIKNNFYMLRFVSKFAPELFIIKSILAITGLIVNFGFNIFFFKYVVDSMEYGGDFIKILWFISLLGLIIIIDGISNSFFSQSIYPRSANKIHKGIHELIFKKISKVELEKYDDESFYDEYIWVLNESDGCIRQAFNIVFSFFYKHNIICFVFFRRFDI